MQLFTPAPSFDDPMGLLLACHGRILGHCDTLACLPGHLAEHGADDEARQAATRILRYFHTAAPQHHADEEENLFPWLTTHLDFPEPLHTTLRHLSLQHRNLEALWEDFAKELEEVAVGHGNTLSPDIFISTHRAHIAIENNEIFPVAARLLSPDILGEIGNAMRTRRAGAQP
ncbi:hemerythrin domain-containing protein [Acidithiobacillus sp. M4-SHS-6]|uniref:hemerythrin domain-containing protein n=1 Tax=Acidithiobacillus sp. M4-SHS-6 TaxID=3383024 RepID=UPI0039BDF163